MNAKWIFPNLVLQEGQGDRLHTYNSDPNVWLLFLIQSGPEKPSAQWVGGGGAGRRLCTSEPAAFAFGRETAPCEHASSDLLVASWALQD